MGHIKKINYRQYYGKSDASDRLSGTLASHFCALNGVDILRVHDIDEHNDLFKVYHALND